MGVLDHADAVGPVQRTGLGRDVGGREAQAEVARVALVGLFGQHQAVALGVEAVSLDPAEAGDALHLLHCVAAQLVDVVGVLQAGDEAAHQRVEIAVGGDGVAGRLELGDQHLVVAVHHHRHRERALLADGEAHVPEVEGIGVFQCQPLQTALEHGGVFEEALEREPDQFAGGQAEPVLDVLAGLHHAATAFIEDQHETVGLDAARDVDGLFGTGFGRSREVLGAVDGCHNAISFRVLAAGKTHTNHRGIDRI